MLTIYSLPGTIVTVIFAGYIYELFGRKITIFLSFFTTALVYLYIPYTAPDFNKLMITRIILGVTMAAPTAHPLIPDYIKSNSRGKAIALNGVGVVLGEVFSMGILFNLTKNMKFEDAFKVASGLLFAFSFFFLFSVKDPKIVSNRSVAAGHHVQRAVNRHRKSQVYMGLPNNDIKSR